MKKTNLIQFFMKQVKSITIEPLLFMIAFSLSLIGGAQVTTNLLIWKICHVELHYSDEVCGNLSLDINKLAEQAVQENVNNFQMRAQWISSVPIIFFSAIAGALSDEFGRKPLMYFPTIGNFLMMIFSIINVAFIDVLPVEFFYMDSINAFFGGYAVFYLGSYSYITCVTNPKERAHRLARLDGFEVFGYVVGTLVSPHILNNLGPSGSYSLGAGVFALALIYLALFVKEPVERKALKTDEKGYIKNLVLTAIKTPFVGMKSLLTKKRKTQLKLLILLQLFMFTIYWMVIEVQMVRYLYMLLVFENFGPTENAYFSVFTNMCTVFSLMVIMPILSSKLKIHDALILFIIVTSEAISSVAAPFAKELWQFWIISGIGSFGLCKYSVVRSLISISIELDEVGKVFSILAVIAAVAPVAGNPIFRQLYNETIASFPGAIFLLAAALLLPAMAGNFLIYIYRDELLIEKEKEVKDNNDNDDKKEKEIATTEDWSLEDTSTHHF